MHTFVVLAYKESKYLEACIKSCINQNDKSKVVIATSTPNTYIKTLADRYKLTLIVNQSSQKGIANDFNFALHCVTSPLVTIAHQDDIYEPSYSETMKQLYKSNENSTILFSRYYEIRDEKKVFINNNLRIKRLLLLPLRINFMNGCLFVKRRILSLGNPICCPAVCYVQEKMPKIVFAGDMKSNVDWQAWEKISKINGKFIYVDECLMGHRVHEESTTTDIINKGIRTQEDQKMFELFWPKGIAKLINKIYRKAENSNN